jgi:hypothetical protein
MKPDSLCGHSTGIRTTCRKAEHFSAKEFCMNVVSVQAPAGTPLMPCSCVIARFLLKEGKAKVKRRTPFTIKLLVQPETTYTQPLTLGVDTGSAVIGSAVASEQGNVLSLSAVTVRNDIATIMKERAKYRRNRRNRKTRYRKARWLNRKNSIKTGRFSPTMRSKIDAHLKEIRFVRSFLPIHHIVLETGTFDPHALKNPEVLKYNWLYQKGINSGFANTKASVLTRDEYTCQHCKGKSKDHRLEVHHIVFRGQNGSDEEANLITLCETCHNALHRGEVTLKRNGKKKGGLKHATQMNSIRVQLLRQVQAEETWGFVTKEHRQGVGLPKEHYFDAVMIATQGVKPTFQTTTLLMKRCLPAGDYQQTKGQRSEQRIMTGKMKGFRKFDKVRYQGQECFIKGRMSTGYAILMDIEGNKLVFKPIPKFGKMQRVSARTSWSMSQRPIASISSSPT